MKTTSEELRRQTKAKLISLASICIWGLGGFLLADSAARVELDGTPFVWALVGGVLGLAIAPLVLRYRDDLRFNAWGMIWFTAIGVGLCAWTGAGAINEHLDNSEGDAFTTTVLARPQQKSTARGKSEDYFLTLTPFLPEHGQQAVTFQVPKKIYRDTVHKKTIGVVVHPGRLGYRWLELRP